MHDGFCDVHKLRAGEVFKIAPKEAETTKILPLVCETMSQVF